MTTSLTTSPPSGDTPNVTAANAHFVFWDIESLRNAFTLVAYSAKYTHAHVFYLLDADSGLHADPQQIVTNIRTTNPVLPDAATITLHDLNTPSANDMLLRMFGASTSRSINNPNEASTLPAHYRTVCDTDPHYDPFAAHPFLAGYNSEQYDTTMLAIYFYELFREYAVTGLMKPTTAKIMRQHSDQLFSETYKKQMYRYLYDLDQSAVSIRRNMINSGRYLDVARLNEKQMRVALKRLLAQEGFQVKESARLSGPNAFLETDDDVAELLGYNASDSIYLNELFKLPLYSGAFDLKHGLMTRYPETVYEADSSGYKPDVRPERVRWRRLTTSSSSAQFVACVLAPYSNLSDIPAVSFEYPHPDSEIVRSGQAMPSNVLDDLWTFFHETVHDAEAQANFQHIYWYYKSIEGKNFNDSAQYRRDYGDKALDVTTFEDIPKMPNNLMYYRADGTPTSCFATFSTGGIHGAQANNNLFMTHRNAGIEKERIINEAKSVYPDPLEMRKAKTVMIDGKEVKHTEVLMSKSSLTRAFYKDVSDAKPDLFKMNGPKTGVSSTKLQPKYVYTSSALAIHEDFSSYYPNLLRNLNAFYNPQLGEDRYTQMYYDKQHYGKLMKDPSLSEDERKMYNILREGTKLVLNTASGAGDASHDTSIRMNNRIISMRLIGQMFSWRIGQAQAVHGADIISTNTDGLYSVLDEETNNRVLAEQAKIINVDIDPEPLLLVSKDSNNRIEIEAPDPTGQVPGWQSRITGASGASLSCYNGPDPSKSLAHPAVVDYGMAHYLRLIAGGYQPKNSDHPLAMHESFNMEVGRSILNELLDNTDPVKLATYFQNVIAASPGSITYPFAMDHPTTYLTDKEGNPTDQLDYSPSAQRNPRAMQHINRLFVVTEGTEDTINIAAAGAWTISAVNKASRSKRGDKSVIIDHEVAEPILRANGLSLVTSDVREGYTKLPENQDVTVRKVSGVEAHWPLLVLNTDLHRMDPDQLRKTIIDKLDIEVYLQMIADEFNDNWRNATATPEAQPQDVPELINAISATSLINDRRAKLAAAQQTRVSLSDGGDGGGA